MYFVSRSPNPRRVFTTHRNERVTEPTATALTTDFEARRPKRPLIRKPMKGKIGMSQSAMGSVLHRADVVNHEGFAVLEHGENDGEAHRSFGRRYNHHEEAEDMSVHLLERVREGDKGQVHGVQHQFDGHEHGDDVTAIDEPRYAQTEQDGAEDQVPAHGHRGWHSTYSSFRASTMAPTMAMRISTEVISKGNR